MAHALAHQACRQGFDVLAADTHKMLRHINGGRADGTLDKRLQIYLRPGLLVLDDFGLKPLTSPAPEDMHNIINERYERGSILLTSLSCRTDRAIAPQWSGPTCSVIHCSPLPGWIA